MEEPEIPKFKIDPTITKSGFIKFKVQSTNIATSADWCKIARSVVKRQPISPSVVEINFRETPQWFLEIVFSEISIDKASQEILTWMDSMGFNVIIIKPVTIKLVIT